MRSDLNRGGPGNYRLAFQLSRGKYFRWATHDDLSSPESLERCVEVLDRDPSIVLAYPKTRIIDESGQTIADYEDGLHLMSPKASDRFVQLLERIGLGNAMYGLIRADILENDRPDRRFRSKRPHSAGRVESPRNVLGSPGGFLLSPDPCSR